MESRGASAYLRQRRDSNSSIVISGASATLLAVPSAMSLGPGTARALQSRLNTGRF